MNRHFVYLFCEEDTLPVFKLRPCTLLYLADFVKDEINMRQLTGLAKYLQGKQLLSLWHMT